MDSGNTGLVLSSYDFYPYTYMIQDIFTKQLTINMSYCLPR